MSCLDLFKSGMDTYDIASRMGISEARVSDLLYRERCKELGFFPAASTNIHPPIGSHAWWKRRHDLYGLGS